MMHYSGYPDVLNHLLLVGPGALGPVFVDLILEYPLHKQRGKLYLALLTASARYTLATQCFVLTYLARFAVAVCPIDMHNRPTF